MLPKQNNNLFKLRPSKKELLIVLLVTDVIILSKITSTIIPRHPTK
jgi:hypothetical protein